MSRFLMDLFFILLILVLGVSLIYRGDNDSNTDSNSSDIDSQVSGNNPITDGDDGAIGLEDYDSNIFAQGLYYLSDGISSAVNYSFEIVIGGIKKVLD